MDSNGKTFKRTFVIGDLHGMYDETIELMTKCGITSEDRVIFVGDLIDRGPDNDKCVELAMKHECVLGNHEECHIRYNDVELAGKDPYVTVPSHVATRLQLKQKHFDYFRSLPLFIRLPEFNAVVVHAGVFPGVPIEAQSPKHLLHAQMLNPAIDKATKWPSKAPEGYKFWTNLWKGPETIIFGHSVLDKPLVTEHAIGIDGGAVFGRALWALELPSMKIHEVLAKKDYGGGVRGRPSAEEIAMGRANAKIKKYLIHGDVSSFS